MTSEQITLIIARNGLDTAEGLMAVRWAELINQAKKLEAAGDKAGAEKLKRKAARARVLARALKAADVGIGEYLKAEGPF